MLVFPAETADTHLPGRFHDGHAENLAANFLMRRFALLLCKVDERLIGSTALTNPSPSKLSESRIVQIVSASGTRS